MCEPIREPGTAEAARPGSLAGPASLRTATQRRTRPRPPSCKHPRVRPVMRRHGPRMTDADRQHVHAFQLIALVQPSCVDDVRSPHVLGIVFPRQVAELVPLRHHNATIGRLDRRLRVRRELDIAIGSYAVTCAPFSWRRWITRIEAASRMSSVSFLKASPRTATRLSSSGPTSLSESSTTLAACRSFVFSTAARRLGSYPRSRLNAISARTSFGKQLPP